MGGKFHFVCHECVEEGVYADRSEAVTARDTHVDRTGHRVSLRQITEAEPRQ